MILRRLATALRKQDWFTVVVETLIVVFGVFIGLQVANWNSARIDRELERAYLLRLHEEVSVTLAEQEGERADVMARARRLEEVSVYLDDFGTPQAIAMEPVGDHCAAVITSHIFDGDVSLPPTISELISTGRILLVSDEALRMQIVRFSQAIEEYGQLRHDIQIDRLVLARKYPEFIRLSRGGWKDSVCDFPAMAQSPAFVNDFLDNAPRFQAYAADVIQGRHDFQQQVKAALEQELGLTSGGAP
ncbi:MAG: hypothetical protein RIA71_16095 [Oceanicaulis sp.]